MGVQVTNMVLTWQTTSLRTSLPFPSVKERNCTPYKLPFQNYSSCFPFFSIRTLMEQLYKLSPNWDVRNRGSSGSCGERLWSSTRDWDSPTKPGAVLCALLETAFYLTLMILTLSEWSLSCNCLIDSLGKLLWNSQVTDVIKASIYLW